MQTLDSIQDCSGIARGAWAAVGDTRRGVTQLLIKIFNNLAICK